MAAILRVKRRRADDPADSLVISSKRARGEKVEEKENDTDVNDLRSVFKFAGTVAQKDGAVGQQVREAIKKAKIQRELHQHQPDVSEKVRKEHKKAVSDARYKIISEKRAAALEALDEVIDDKDGEQKFRLYDLATGRGEVEDACVLTREKQETSSEGTSSEKITCNGVEMVREQVAPPVVETEADCVYDLYYINDPKFDFRNMENILAIEAYREELIFDERPASEDDEVYDDEDDPDDEGNWRNDYPDEDTPFCKEDEEEDSSMAGLGSYGDSDDDYSKPYDSDDDEFYAAMMEKQLNLDEDGDLSSEDDSDFVYFKNPLDMGAAATPSAYDRYKQRVEKELNDSEVKEEMEDAEVDDEGL